MNHSQRPVRLQLHCNRQFSAVSPLKSSGCAAALHSRTHRQHARECVSLLSAKLSVDCLFSIVYVPAMFYRFHKRRRTQRLNRAIGGILDTPPLRIQPAPWCIASMVANSDVPMYLLSLKSFYPKLGRGKIAAIIDRDMPQSLRDTLAQHVPGMEFVILEDIATGSCQRGGTWERLLYVLDRSESEYTIQLDADTLTVGDNLDEVIRCVETNTPFTMSDGFDLMSLPKVAEEAEATPSEYIGIITERLFARYPDEGLRYVRGSSGFAGFSRGGFTRAGITRFHEEMEKLVGTTRWRGWGSEQCGSNFAIANSSGAVVLPYPQYASFTRHTARREAKFFHFIGANRFLGDYYAARGQELIAKLRPGSVPTIRVKQSDPQVDTLPFAFARALTPPSAMRYLAWRLGGKRGNTWLRLRSEPEFVGPEFALRPSSVGNNDFDVAYEIFVHNYLRVPVRIPPERVKLIVDLGANVGMSCLYWLAVYWRAEVIAFEPDPSNAAQCRINLERNGLLRRATLHGVAAGVAPGRARISDTGTLSQMGTASSGGYEAEVVDIFALLLDCRIDILKIDINGGEYALLEDPRFGELDVRSIIMEWHERDDRPDGHAWCCERLKELGFQLYPVFEQKSHGMMWAYRSQPVERPSASWQLPVPPHRAHDPSSDHVSLAALAGHSLSRPFSERG
jgi:FkbM family methyltransferase